MLGGTSHWDNIIIYNPVTLTDEKEAGLSNPDTLDFSDMFGDGKPNYNFRLRELQAQGLTAKEAAEQVGLCVDKVLAIARKLQIKFVKARNIKTSFDDLYEFCKEKYLERLKVDPVASLNSVIKIVREVHGWIISNHKKGKVLARLKQEGIYKGLYKGKCLWEVAN
jgi:flagellin-specific chaperone FliS